MRKITAFAQRGRSLRKAPFYPYVPCFRNAVYKVTLTCQFVNLFRGFLGPFGAAEASRSAFRIRKKPAFRRANRAPRAGLEPATPRLTAECSAIELSRNGYSIGILAFFHDVKQKPRTDPRFLRAEKEGPCDSRLKPLACISSGSCVSSLRRRRD